MINLMFCLTLTLHALHFYCRTKYTYLQRENKIILLTWRQRTVKGRLQDLKRQTVLIIWKTTKYQKRDPSKYIHTLWQSQLVSMCDWPVISQHWSHDWHHHIEAPVFLLFVQINFRWETVTTKSKFEYSFFDQISAAVSWVGGNQRHLPHATQGQKVDSFQVTWEQW